MYYIYKLSKVKLYYKLYNKSIYIRATDNSVASKLIIF